jgi:hypothetical protein
MICLECKQVMPQFPSGAFTRCCNGIGYYWPAAPNPRDAMFSVAAPKTQRGYIYRNWFRSIPR